jgi:hypothetical protein
MPNLSGTVGTWALPPSRSFRVPPISHRSSDAIAALALAFGALNALSLSQAIERLEQEVSNLDDDDERRACERSLLAFTHVGRRWAGEPGRFVECMCEHLEAVANRQILRLLINVPPRHYKSMGERILYIVSVGAGP